MTTYGSRIERAGWIVISRGEATTLEFWNGKNWIGTPDLDFESCEAAGREMDRAGLDPELCKIAIVGGLAGSDCD